MLHLEEGEGWIRRAKWVMAQRQRPRISPRSAIVVSFIIVAADLSLHNNVVTVLHVRHTDWLAEMAQVVPVCSADVVASSPIQFFDIHPDQPLDFARESRCFVCRALDDLHYFLL